MYLPFCRSLLLSQTLKKKLGYTIVYTIYFSIHGFSMVSHTFLSQLSCNYCSEAEAFLSVIEMSNKYVYVCPFDGHKIGFQPKGGAGGKFYYNRMII